MLNRFRNVHKKGEFEIICVDLMYQKNSGNLYFEKLYLLMNSMNEWEIDSDCVKVIVNFLFDIFREDCLNIRKERLRKERLSPVFSNDRQISLVIDRFMKLKYNDMYIVIYEPTVTNHRLSSPTILIAKCLKKGKEVKHEWRVQGFLSFPGDHNFGKIHMIFDKECIGVGQYLVSKTV